MVEQVVANLVIRLVEVVELAQQVEVLPVLPLQVVVEQE
tara:strand:+ start:194 stop:310 length:117 start_codon:yes stop_codon:yes gene_type:complete